MAKNRVISAVLTLKDKDFSSNAKKATSATKDMERKLKSANNSVTGFGKSATSSFKRIAAGAASIVAAIGVTKLLSGAFNMVKSSISSAFSRIDTMESFERVMTVLTGSAKDTQLALDRTRESVIGTAYGLDVAAKAVQDFVTRGVTVDKATKYVAAFGDAVAFYGKGSNEQLATVNDALAKMTTKGKVSMDQLNRLFDAGIDAVGMYAKATGQEAEYVQDKLSDGTITTEKFLDVVTKAMMEGTNGVTKIAGAAKEAGASWGASFDNMRAAVTRGTTKIIGSIDDMLKDKGLPDMRSMVSSFGGKFEEVLGKAAGVVAPLGDKLFAAYEKAKPGLEWLKDTAIPGIRDELVNAYEKAKPGLEWLKDTALPGVVDAVGFVIDKATDLYAYVKDNWSLIGPIVAGVAASVTAFKFGVIGLTAAQTVWKVVTSGVQIATALLNGTLAISPLGWVALAIGAVVTAGIFLWKNWDTIKEKAQELWGKTKAVGTGIKLAFTTAFDMVKKAVASSINFVIDKINGLIEKINVIPGVKIPVIPRVEWGSAEASGSAGRIAGGSVMAAYDVGTNRVSHDQVAKIHKDEMIVPAVQARNLRRQGVTIDNIDQQQQKQSFQVSNISSKGDLSAMIAQLIQLIKNMPKGDVNIYIDGYNKSVSEIVNELIPALKLRLANM